MAKLINSTSGAEREELINMCLNILKGSKTIKITDIVGNDQQARDLLSKEGKK